MLKRHCVPWWEDKVLQMATTPMNCTFHQNRETEEAIRGFLPSHSRRYSAVDKSEPLSWLVHPSQLSHIGCQRLIAQSCHLLHRAATGQPMGATWKTAPLNPSLWRQLVSNSSVTQKQKRWNQLYYRILDFRAPNGIGLHINPS